MKKRSFYKDIMRTLKNNLSRFIAIVVMVALGSGVFAGFAVGCLNVFQSADRFYASQNMYDIKIASTLGLTEADLTAVAGVAGVKSVFANCSQDVKVKQNDGKSLQANLTTLDVNGINEPYVLEGSLPTKVGQIAVNSKFINDTGLKLGDMVTLENVETEEEADKEAAVADTEKEAGKATASDTEKETAKEAATSDKEKETAKEATTSDKEKEADKETVASDTGTGNENDLDITIDNDSTKPSLAVSEYAITAIILSPLDISNREGSIAAISFSTSSSNYLLYVTPDCINSNVYTAIYLTIDGASKLNCYSEEYQTLVEDMSSKIETTIQKERELARYNEVVGNANTKIADAEALLADKMTEAEQKLTDAQKEIDDGWVKIKDGWEEVKANEAKLADGEKKLAGAQKTTEDKFAASQKEINDGRNDLDAGEEKLKGEEKTALEQFAVYEQQLSQNQVELDNQKSEADSQLGSIIAELSAAKIWNEESTKQIWEGMISDGVKAAPYLLAEKQGEKLTEEQTKTYSTAMSDLQKDSQALAEKLVSAGIYPTREQMTAFSTLAITYGTINYSRTQLEEKSAQLAKQKADALDQIVKGRLEIENGRAKLAAGQKKLEEGKATAAAQFAEKEKELEEGKQKLTDAKEELQESEDKLTDGQEELDKNKLDYENSIAKAQQKLSDAKEDIAGIGMTKWYVWDRGDNDSFAGLHGDISFVQEITKAFPFIFFLVAILISLTTMTRMVEEDRGLIGTYKSLGYSKYQISLKYIFYSVLACIIGGLLGSVIGFYLIPKIIEIIFSSMYIIPAFKLSFYLNYGLGGFGLFLLGIVGATVISCAEMLHKRPAELMRPKAPKAGSRILLERVPFLWKRLNFLNKVTSRNLFRYKKRAIMTIVGILGCTMLIVFGFGIRDTVGGLMPDQFDTITVYDAIAVTDDLSAGEMNQMAKEWNNSGMVASELQLKMTSLTLHKQKDHLEITVMVIPDGADFGSYVHLYDSVTHDPMTLPPDGIVVTQNAAKELRLSKGDTVSLLNEDNVEYPFPVAFVTTNYAGNYVYISESCYQAAFGDYSGNSFLVKLSDQIQGQKWLTSLSSDHRILTVSNNQEVRDSFKDVNKIINMIVYLLIGMSAVLAFAVLFTLSNINISERERELATVKVLGFFPREVYSYVNKETLILTFLGILLGLPTGYGITYIILANVSIADVAFKVHVSVTAYLIAAILTLTFTFIVNRITNKSLHKIDMVGALKSVE